MNKLISKNPVQRFKQGKKIQKAGFGTVLEALGYAVGLHKPEVRNGIQKTPQITGDYLYTTGGRWGRLASQDEINKSWRNSAPKDYSFMTKGRINPESEQSKKDREDYFNKQKQKYNFVSTPSKSIISRKTPIDNYYVKGFGGNGLKEEIAKEGGVRAMQNKLIKLGLLNDKFGADGRWGENTQKAYEAYKSIASGLNPIVPTELEAGPIEKTPIIQSTPSQIYQNDFAQDKFNNYSGTVERTPIVQAPYIPFVSGAQLAQAAKRYTKLAKQGGQLVSKNPIQRFKRNFRYVAQ